MLVRLWSCCAILAASSLVPAQTPPRLIGLSTNPLVPLTANLRQDWSACTTVSCVLAMPTPATATPWAGGTAYDAAKQAVWHTNGTTIGLFDPATCAPLCGPLQLAPIIGAGASATGLALNDSTKTLWMTDDTSMLYQLASTCPLAASTKCPLAGVIPTGQTIGGLATADVQGLIFYSASNWTGAPNNRVYVAYQATPCTPICSFLIPGCGGLTLGAITGLAYDECKRVLWVTDGVLVHGVTWINTPFGCTSQTAGCCRVPAPDRYVGLCVEPSHAVSLAASCTAPSCPACPAMRHDVGDAAMGNPAFSLALNNAPANATAVMCLNVGACWLPGLPIAPFCGNLHVPFPGMVTFGFATGAGVGCAGSVNLSLAVPMNPALCGVVLSTQFLVLCTAPAIGTGVSNCQSWAVSAT